VLPGNVVVVATDVEVGADVVEVVDFFVVVDTGGFGGAGLLLESPKYRPAPIAAAASTPITAITIGFLLGPPGPTGPAPPGNPGGGG
jgi:hypothetical protein